MTHGRPLAMIPRRPILWVLIALSVVILTLGLAPVGKRSVLADTFQTFGHFGFFAILAITLTVGSRWLHPAVAAHRGWQYAIGFTSAVILGGLLEWAQKFVPSRTPSLHDLIYDGLGGFAGIALLIALNYRHPLDGIQRALKITALLLFAAAVLVSRVNGVRLFLIRPANTVTLYVGNFRLE